MSSCTDNIFKGYVSKLKDWDTSSTVRSSRETYNIDKCYYSLAKDSLSWHLPTYAPILQHDALSSLTTAQQQYVLGMQLLEFTEKTTKFEIDFVNVVAANISFNKYHFDLPEIMLSDAYKIYTDEAYHAYFSEKICQQIRDIYQEQKLGHFVNIYLNKLTAIEAKMAENERYLLLLGIVFISETMIVSDMAEQMKGIVFEPIRAMFKDHMHDEAYHCIYFSTLFKLVWPQLGEKEKETLGLCLHDLLLIMAAPRTDVYYYSLAKLGFNELQITEIIRDTFNSAAITEKIKNKANVTIRLFEKTGVFDVPHVKSKFVNSGLI